MSTPAETGPSRRLTPKDRCAQFANGRRDQPSCLPGARREALRVKALAVGLEVPDALVSAWRGS